MCDDGRHASCRGVVRIEGLVFGLDQRPLVGHVDPTSDGIDGDHAASKPRSLGEASVAGGPARTLRLGLSRATARVREVERGAESHDGGAAGAAP